MDLRTLRIDQNGSLVRPLPLLEAFDRHAQGRASDAELRAVQDEAIRAVIRKQEAVGLPVRSICCVAATRRRVPLPNWEGGG